jgi:hypothetical protein
MADGRVLSSGAEVASALQLETGFRTEPWRVGQQQVSELLGGATGDVDLQARVSNLGFLNAYLSKLPWLGLGGSGDLALDLKLDQGALESGSAMSLDGDALRLNSFL